MSKSTALTELTCQGNLFTAEGLDALFGTLPSNTGRKTIYIYNNPGTSDCDQSIADGKGLAFRE